MQCRKLQYLRQLCRCFKIGDDLENGTFLPPTSNILMITHINIPIFFKTFFWGGGGQNNSLIYKRKFDLQNMR